MNRLHCTENLRGSILAYGLIIMFSISIIMTSIISFVASQTKYALQSHAKEQAFQIAESGIQFYRWYLAHQVEGRSAQQVEDFWTSGTAYGVDEPYEVEYADPGGDVIGKYRLEVIPPTSGTTVVTVKSTAWTYRYPAQQRIINVRFRKPVWSEYIVLANDTLRFGAGTEVFGKIHSNQGIRFDAIAHNIVSSSLYSYNDPDHSGNDEFGVHTHTAPVDPLPPAAVPDRPDVFRGGRALEVGTVDFTGVLGDLNYIKSQALSGVNGSLYFNNDHQGRHIILNTDDTFSIRTVRSFNASTNMINNYDGSWATYPIPNNGAIFVENHVWVEGTLDGRKVTIVAANLSSASLKNVYLGKDIRYTNNDCTDVLGIIAQSDIEVYKGSEDDLRIDAALLAQNGRVGRAHYTGNGTNKSVITLFGALATNQRYGFSWTDNTGYTTRNLYFDNNLLYCPPPYFPSGTQYEMDLWEEE